MANYILISTMILYVAAGIIYAYTSKIGLSMAVFSYAIANLGLILAARGV